MDNVLVLTIVIVAVALLFDFTNGFNDSANIVATMISTRAISPRTALWIASLFEFIGAAFLGTAVARMIAGGIINAKFFNHPMTSWMVLAALIGAIAWNICSWLLKVPSSSSHALVGGLIGAFVSGCGVRVLLKGNLLLLVIVMIIAPLLAFLVSFIITKCMYFLGGWMTVRANSIFKKLQIVSSIGLALSHGTNDAQKTMGVITISLIALGWVKPEAQGIIIPQWVIFSCAATIALGIGMGARRIIRTMGMNIYKIKPVHGFCSQTSSALIIYSAASLGFVVSTSQVVSTSIAGSGTAEKIRSVRWETVGNIIFAWFITMPAAAGVAAGCYFIFTLIQ